MSFREVSGHPSRSMEGPSNTVNFSVAANAVSHLDGSLIDQCCFLHSHKLCGRGCHGCSCIALGPQPPTQCLAQRHKASRVGEHMNLRQIQLSHAWLPALGVASGWVRTLITPRKPQGLEHEVTFTRPHGSCLVTSGLLWNP